MDSGIFYEKIFSDKIELAWLHTPLHPRPHDRPGLRPETFAPNFHDGSRARYPSEWVIELAKPSQSHATSLPLDLADDFLTRSGRGGLAEERFLRQLDDIRSVPETSDAAVRTIAPPLPALRAQRNFREPKFTARYD